MRRVRQPTIPVHHRPGPWLELQPAGAAAPPTPPTRCRLAWGRTGLRIRFVGAVDPGQRCRPLGDQGRLWTQAAVEMFLQPDPRRAEYLEVEVAPDGAVLVLLVAGLGSARRRWEPWRHGDLGVTARSVLTQARWTVDLRLPWSTLAGIADAPVAGDTWRLNLTRCGTAAGGHQFSSLASLGEIDFHRPQDFLPIRFMD